jgi:hypothetical protein
MTDAIASGVGIALAIKGKYFNQSNLLMKHALQGSTNWINKMYFLSIAALLTTAFAAATNKGGVSQKGSVCTVTALGGNKDDVPNILDAFSRCGKDGTVVFPETENYWIATRLNPVLSNVTIEWRGVWTVCVSRTTYNIILIPCVAVR